ncbi:MAG: M23 family metallopeptidase [Rikenellaceae bacterium]
MKKLKLSRYGKLVALLGFLIIVIIVMGIMLLSRSCGDSSNSGDVQKNDSDSTTKFTPELLESSTKNQNTEQKSVKFSNYLEELVFEQSRSRFKYGIAIDNYNLENGKIEKGQTFSKLLNDKYNVNIAIINELIPKCEGVFDLREMRLDNPYVVFINKQGVVDYLVYEKNSIEYIVFCTKAGATYVKADKRNVVTHEKYSEGIITSSLYATIYEEHLSPMLAQKLDEIYKWSIDFFALQSGDSFRVLYEEKYIDTTRVGIGKIYGAEFSHMGKSYLAISFEQGDEDGYWDADGNNLRKNFLQSPLSFSARVSSAYGVRIHPIKRTRQMHNGVDYAAPAGTPVHAIADGTVTRAGWDSGGGGNRIWLKHAHGLESAYLHLRGFAKGIKSGVRVKQGDVIGYVGSTGMSTGAHLDFRVKQNDKYINPQKIPSTPTTPILDPNKERFEGMMMDVLEVMNQYRSDK